MELRNDSRNSDVLKKSTKLISVSSPVLGSWKATKTTVMTGTMRKTNRNRPINKARPPAPHWLRENEFKSVPR